MNDDPARDLRGRLVRVLLVGAVICGGAVALLGPKPQVLAPIIGGALLGLVLSIRAIRRAAPKGEDAAGGPHG